MTEKSKLAVSPRAFWKGFAACYLIGALAFAGAGHRAIPCQTMIGSVYYGVLWPLAPLSVAINVDLYSIPEWACEAPHD